MFRSIAGGMVVLAACLQAALASAAPEWRVDRRVELAAALCRLAGFDEFQVRNAPGYDEAVSEHFAAFAGHPAVKTLQRLRRERDIGHNAPVGAALLLDERGWTQRVPITPWPSYLDARWDKASLSAFLDALATFARDTKANEFFDKQEGLYAEIEKLHRDRFPAEPDLGWYGSHFGTPAKTLVRLAPGLLTGPNSFGMRVVHPDGQLEIVAVIALPPHDATRPLEIADQTLSLVVHEVCHSFANPWVDRHHDRLAASGERLFQSVASTLRAQAYTSWQMMLYESIVRAATIRYLSDHGKNALANWTLKEDRADGFWWTDDLAGLLVRREATAQPALESQVGAIVSFFEGWAAEPTKRIAQKREAVEADRQARRREGPQILGLVPPDGDMSVDPSVSALEIRFDRAMSPSMSLYGAAPRLTGKPSWSADWTVLTIPVSLSPGTTYTLSMNSDEVDGGFRSAAGEILAPRTWSFKVR